MDTDKCVLCGGKFFRNPTPFHNDVNFFTYGCQRCGELIVQRGSGPIIENEWEDEDLFKLACLVRECRLKGEEGQFGILPSSFKLGENTIDKHLARWWRVPEVKSEFPKATEMIDRALLNLSRKVEHPMDVVEMSYDDLQYMLFCPQKRLRVMLGYMRDMGLLGSGNDNRAAADIAITPKGLLRIDELKKTPRESMQAFVAMKFSPETDPFYAEGIKLAISDAGYNAMRIDKKEHNNLIPDEMILEIRKSRFLIADFTGQRGGVYFEAGYAMGMGLPIIWLVKRDDIDNLHFDIRQYNHIVYETADELKEKLRNRIEATIN